MPEAIRAALARQNTTSPRDARLFSAMTQAQFGQWFGVSTRTVQRAEEDANWERYPPAALRTVSLWLALFGPDPEGAFRAVGRWALTPDIENAADAIFIRATVGPDPIEAAIAAALGRDKKQAS